MSRTIIEDQSDRLYPAALCFCDDDRLEKGTEVDEAFAWMALPRDDPISNASCCHQMQDTMPDVAR